MKKPFGMLLFCSVLAAGRAPLCMALRINDNDGVNNSPERGRKGFLFWSDDPSEARLFWGMGIDTVLTNNYWQVAQAREIFWKEKEAKMANGG